MANPSVENVGATSDKAMLAVGVLLAVAGLIAFRFLPGQQWYVRAALLLIGVGVGVAVALRSASGKEFIAFAKDSYREVRKVVWPTRKEAGQTTAIVFVFVLAMAIYLWVSDKTIEWVIFSLILGWR
jgi:preprotein translocase subunit SecE